MAQLYFSALYNFLTAAHVCLSARQLTLGYWGRACTAQSRTNEAAAIVKGCRTSYTSINGDEQTIELQLNGALRIQSAVGAVEGERRAL
jgi:hypothetical protein